MIQNEWNIYWNEYSADTYLYGTKLKFHSKTDVEYKNMLMPPGTVIKRWYSQTNYQKQRIEPTLPIIDGESSYQLVINVETKENEAVLVRLVFYDRYEEEAGFVNVTNSVTNFKCPLKTYSYELQLINAGVTEFRFHSITIREMIDDVG